MKLVNTDGTTEEIVVIAQQHLHALVSIAKAALELNGKIDDHRCMEFSIPDVVNQYNNRLAGKLKNYGEL